MLILNPILLLSLLGPLNISFSSSALFVIGTISSTQMAQMITVYVDSLSNLLKIPSRAALNNLGVTVPLSYPSIYIDLVAIFVESDS